MSADPTKTVTLRRQFRAALRRRFKRIPVRAKLDALLNPLQANRTAYARPADKLAEFQAWLADQLRAKVLESTSITGAAPGTRWTDTYIRAAWQKGQAHAASRVRQAGVEVQDAFLDTAFTRPIQAERLKLVYARAYADLEGITEQMATQMSRALANGMAAGDNPRDIARALRDKLKIGINRAETLARTEIVSAHADATLTTYEEAGVKGVSTEAEWITAGDSRVCERCASHEGKVYTIDEARGLIPLHPRCRCAWLPRID